MDVTGATAEALKAVVGVVSNCRMDRHAGKRRRLAMTMVFVIARSLRRSSPYDDHSQRHRDSTGGSVGISTGMGDWGDCAETN